MAFPDVEQFVENFAEALMKCRGHGEAFRCFRAERKATAGIGLHRPAEKHEIIAAGQFLASDQLAQRTLWGRLRMTPSGPLSSGRVTSTTVRENWIEHVRCATSRKCAPFPSAPALAQARAQNGGKREHNAEDLCI